MWISILPQDEHDGMPFTVGCISEYYFERAKNFYFGQRTVNAAKNRCL